jgi:hypothetical protein
MDSKTIRKYSKRDYTWLHEKAKFYFHKYIRLRDCDDYGNARCIATGQPIKYGYNLHAGHYFAAGKHKALEFNEDNVHGQSLQDNYYGHDFASYSKNLRLKIGDERFEKLEQLAVISKRTPFNQDRYLMIDIIETYKVKVAKLAKEKMFKV